MATQITERPQANIEDNRLKPPPLYKVILLNDDFTPMDFVVQILQQFFGKTREHAMQLMLRVHNQGSAVCGTYPRDVAETKVQQVTEAARIAQHPLQCLMEET